VTERVWAACEFIHKLRSWQRDTARTRDACQVGDLESPARHENPTVALRLQVSSRRGVALSAWCRAAGRLRSARCKAPTISTTLRLEEPPWRIAMLDYCIASDTEAPTKPRGAAGCG
jgi:hypothetical protein